MFQNLQQLSDKLSDQKADKEYVAMEVDVVSFYNSIITHIPDVYIQDFLTLVLESANKMENYCC